MTTDGWVELGGVGAASLAAVAALLVVGLHLARTDVDPRRDGVSAYALTRLGAMYRAQVVATGVAGLLLVAALIVADDGSFPGALVLMLFAISRILIARYPTDPRGTTTLSHAGRRHVLLAATTFVTIAIAAPWVSTTLGEVQDWRGPTAAIVALGWATALFALATFATTTLPATRRYFGLVERAAYAAWLLWIASTSLALAGRL